MHTCHHPELTEGVQFLEDDESLHVSKVLRLKVGDKVRLIDGEGGVALGTLVEVGKRKAQVVVEKVDRHSARPRSLVLLVSPTKSTDRFEWLLEKCTELGAEAIVPIWTERSERKIEKRERWERVVVAATKQCQRLWKPKLHEAMPLMEVPDRVEYLSNRPGAVAHCMTPVKKSAGKLSWTDWQLKHEAAWIAIGPEGDFTPAEVEWLVASGAQEVHLGELRLRTETAGVAAMAQFGKSSGVVQ